MKILYVITKSNWGGAQKYVYDLAVSFSGKGHDITVASGGRGELMERLTEANIKTISIPSMVRNLGLVREIKAFISIYKIIKEVKPEILHLNSAKASALGAFAGRLAGTKSIVFTIHGAPFREDRNIGIKLFYYLGTWATCLLVHKIITISKQDEHDICSMWFTKKKVTTVYPGIPYKEIPERITPRTRTTHIVTIAELHKNKGLLYGLSAISKLLGDYMNITYSIFGEGEDRQKIEQYIKMKRLEDIVTLHGHVSDAALRIHEYDIFLLPSIKEGLPYTLLEAGRAMLPVVTTTTGGIPEIIRHEQTGLLVQPKDDDHLKEELKKLIQDRNYAKKLGQNLHAHVVQQFSQSKMLVETAKVYGFI
ncbi:MAG: glycosyl transferase family protein [Candidatus Nomurabacteria bacterium]|nr:glycosyl transferase family protein [Candidatus Nomurabacteria bacterium]